MSAVFLKVVQMSLSASWMVLAVLVLRRCLRRAPKWVNVLLWGIVAVRLACPFSFESALSLMPRASVTVGPRPAVRTGVAALDRVIAPAISSALTPAPGASADPLQIWIAVLAAVWLAGMAAIALYVAVSYGRLRYRVREAVRLRGNIYQSERVDAPFVLGVVRPRIYLPYHMDGRDQGHVIAHEQAHLRRGDQLWKPLGLLLLTVHWFNPLVWLAYGRLCRDIELACDEKVIRGLGNEDRANYMQALVACSVGRRRAAVCPLAFGEFGVKERVKSVMNYKKPTFWVILLAVVACVVLAVCFLTDPVGDKDSAPADAAVSTGENTPADPSGTAPEAPVLTAEPVEPETPDQPAQPEEAPALDAAITAAVLDHYADSAGEGRLHVESHVLLAQEGDAEQVTAYLLVLQESFRTDGGTLTVENGSYVPTAITFRADGTMEEYWEPGDGSYAEDIRGKFPAEAAEEALNDQAYIEDLTAACEQQARDAMNAAN